LTIRYVVIATAARGAIEPHEPLDDDGQMSAWAAYRLDMTAPMERVIWDRPLPAAREKQRRIDRVMQLARKVG
jgi:hypothetical protein